MTGSNQQGNLQDHSDLSHGVCLGFDTRAIHHAFDPAAFSRAVQPPVFLTSTYGFESVAANDA
ncbi:methionine-gamma-lyase, partial [Rhizobium mongolense]|nr:methionine-gamma-lyase [Rhizobium mongolense]